MKRIELHEIGEQGFDAHGDVDAETCEALLGDESMGYVWAQTGHYSVYLTRVKDAVRAVGNASFFLKTSCSRCLTEVAVPIENSIDVTLFAQGHEPVASSPDGELLEEDMGVSCYDNDTVDLEALLREELLLCLPMASLCREDCAGLCLECGNNNNERPCGCHKPVDPRFSVLTTLVQTDTP